MASLKLTPKFAEVVTEMFCENFSLTEEEQQIINAAVDSKIVTCDALFIVNKYMKTKPSLLMKDIFDRSKLVFPSSEKASKQEVNPKLLKRREYLKRRQETREYNQMIFGTDYNPQDEAFTKCGNSFASMRNQLTISANMIVSIFVSFGLGYYLSKSVTKDESMRMTIGLVCAIIIMMIEMILFILRAIRMEDVYENKSSKAAAKARATWQRGLSLNNMHMNTESGSRG
jgi:hypothetical protein